MGSWAWLVVRTKGPDKALLIYLFGSMPPLREMLTCKQQLRGIVSKRKENADMLFREVRMERREGI
jgi:hypothetical protein